MLPPRSGPMSLSQPRMCVSDSDDAIVIPDFWDHRWIGSFLWNGRLERFRAGGQLPRDKVVVNRDIILISGDNQEDLEKWMLGTVFGIQGNPWRLEIDCWRSFIDVELGFLEGLDKEWLDLHDEWID